MVVMMTITSLMAQQLLDHGNAGNQGSMQGVGVGNESATAASAVVTWLLRDGAGMVGRILFTWLKGVTVEIALMCVLIGDATRGEPNTHN